MKWLRCWGEKGGKEYVCETAIGAEGWWRKCAFELVCMQCFLLPINPKYGTHDSSTDVSVELSIDF